MLHLYVLYTSNDVPCIICRLFLNIILANQIKRGKGMMSDNIGISLRKPISDCSKSIIGSMHIRGAICPKPFKGKADKIVRFFAWHAMQLVDLY